MYLVIGETPAARRVCATLEGEGSAVHLVAPTDAELDDVLRAGIVAAAVLVREDVQALRYALALAHLDPTVPQVVTLFDKTMADQLRAFLPQATVVSPAALSAPGMGGAALDADCAWIRSEPRLVRRVRHTAEGGLEETESEPVAIPLVRRLVSALRWDHRHHDAGTRLMMLGLLGLVSLLLVDWAWLVLIQHHRVDTSLLDAARVVATVGPGPTEAVGAYAAWSAVAMLASIGFTAMFTAGLIDRLFEPRLLSMIGSRTVPRRHHVIVVGMGQLGVRLCELLLSLDVPVVGVERDRSARWLPLARSLGIPVLLGEGTERRVLEKLRLGHSRSLVAVGSDDLDNVAVAVAASAVSPSTRVILRAGEQEAIAETRSLMPLGVIRDVTELAAAFVVAHLHGEEADGVLSGADVPHLRIGFDSFCPAPVASRDECVHQT